MEKATNLILILGKFLLWLLPLIDAALICTALIFPTLNFCKFVWNSKNRYPTSVWYCALLKNLVTKILKDHGQKMS